MKSLSQLYSDWRAAREKMEAATQSLPRVIGVTVVGIVKQNFRLQGYDKGTGKESWPKRKDSTNKAYSYGRGKGGKSKLKGSVFNANNPILIQTHNLMNAVAYKAMVKKVFIGVNTALVPYAKIHNEGGRGNAFGHPFTMPKRQYMPQPRERANNLKILKAVKNKIIFVRSQAMKTFQK